MTKLLHERMRDLNYEGGCTGNVLASVGYRVKADCSLKCKDCIAQVMKALADEIERCYIPRTEHETEVKRIIEAQCGGRIEYGKSPHHIMKTYAEAREMPMESESMIVTAISRSGVPLATSGSKIVSIASTTDDGLVKRRTKVLDADGVEIKVGKPIYDSKGEYKTVQGFEGDEDEWLVWCGEYESNTGIKVCYIPSECTHRDPDSLEKLRDEMREAMATSPDAMFMDSRWVDRLTALIERGA